jgi:type I restriction enzyme S subunit
MILSDYLNGVVDNRGRNPDRYFEKEKYPVIDNFLIKNELHPNILQASRYIDEQTYQNFLRGYIYPNMVIMTLVGNGIGNVTTISDPNSVIIQNTIGFDVKKDLLSDLFLFYFFYHKLDTIKQFDRGSGQPSIKKTDILNMEVDFPPLEIQKKIAGVLGALDDKIELNNKINNNLEQQAQALFKSWFVDKEYEVERETTLGVVCKCELGGTPSRIKSEYWGGNIAWINSGEVNNFRITKASEYITEIGLKHSATKLLPRKTTVLAITGATLGQISLLEIDSCTNQSVVGVLENETLPYEFIYPYICYNIKELLSHQTGGAQQHINKQNVEQLTLSLPKSTLIKDYKNIVAPIFELIAKNCFESERLAAIRDALLPKLMSGEIDVSNVDISALTSTDKLSFTED